MNRRPPKPALKQPTPKELLDHLCDFIERKFYAGRPVDFTKDRRRLLEWVILWPAAWLNQRGVTIPPDRYREIVERVMFDALAHGNTGQITYLPAWLAKVIQSHFACHGDEIYEQAKCMRNLVEHAAAALGKLHVRQTPDPVFELAEARRLLIADRRAKKAASRRPLPSPASSINGQLTLL